jgi:hypothetical protein
MVESEFGKGRPDLALIDDEYRLWYVVEVELDAHPLKQHVEEQIRKFAAGDYNQSHVDALVREDPQLDSSRVADMMRGEQPKVLVLVTRQKPEWALTLSQYRASVGVIEIFRDDLDNVVLRVNGDQPAALDSEVLSKCTADRSLSRALQIHSPGPFAGQNQVDLLYGGNSTRWSVVRVQDMAYFLPDERFAMRIQGGSKWEVRRIGLDLVLAEEE